MNGTQWFFENESINIEEERKYDDLALVARAAKKAVIQLLGLNILPIEDEDTGKLRMREDHEIIPLLPAICREDVAKELIEKFTDMQAQDLAMDQIQEEKNIGSEMSAEEFDDFMDSDLEFIDEDEVKRLSIIKSPEYKYISKNIIDKMSKEDKANFKQLFGDNPNINFETAKEVLPKPKSVKIEPELVEESVFGSSPNKRKVQITIESEEE